MLNKFKKLDLFSKPFSFKIDSSDTGLKTILGAILSILILLLSLSYFIYLMYIWISSEMSPKV